MEEQMGHSDGSVQARYAHAAADMVRRPLDGLTAVWESALEARRQLSPGSPVAVMSRDLTVRPRCRVVLDNDCSGDPDGLVALARHLLSRANRVVAVTSSFLRLGGRTRDGSAGVRPARCVVVAAVHQAAAGLGRAG